MAVDGWAVISGTARRGLGGAAARPGPLIIITDLYSAFRSEDTKTLLAVPNVTPHPSTASVPVTAFLYNGPLLCGFNVPIKGLTLAVRHKERSKYVTRKSGFTKTRQISCSNLITAGKL